MTNRDWLTQQRLHRQRLLANPLASPHEVVSSLAAVQAQDYAGARWSLGLRTQGATDVAIEQTVDAGVILRTHVLRPTWHFVALRDIRWLLALTGPHVHKVNAHPYRQHELDKDLLLRSRAIVASALRDGQALTRAELAAALAAAGIPAAGLRLAYILMAAELDGVICSGPRRGKQFTYMLLARRAPGEERMDRDSALVELTRRYFSGHGPATERDYARWSGLKLTDARRGIDMVRSDLGHEEIDGATFWFASPAAIALPGSADALLLPAYDEFFLGFAASLRLDAPDPRTLVFDSNILVDGRIAGTWRRQFEKGGAILQVVPLPPFSATDPRLAAAADRCAAFLQAPVEIRQVNESELKTTGWRRSRLATLDAEAPAS